MRSQVSPNTSGPMSLGGLPSVLEGPADGGKSGNSPPGIQPVILPVMLTGGVHS